MTSPREGGSVTLVMPVFNGQSMLDRQLRHWATFSEVSRRRLRVVLVDDHSDVPVQLPDPPPVSVVLARVLEPLAWNQPGARNLGMRIARRGWTLLTDIDHLLPEETLREATKLLGDRRRVHTFARRTVDGSPFRTHPNSFLIHRDTFWEAGGYDEDFVGHYGFDDLLFKDLLEQTFDLRHAAELFLVTDPGEETRGLDRSTSRNLRRYKWKRRLLNWGLYRNGPLLRFDWTLVTATGP